MVISELRDRLHSVQSAEEDLSVRLKEKEGVFTRAVESLKESHKAELNQKDTDHKRKVMELEVDTICTVCDIFGFLW